MGRAADKTMVLRTLADEEMQPLDEKYAAKSPVNYPRLSIWMACLIVGVFLLYSCNNQSSSDDSRTAHYANHELHQTIRNQTKDDVVTLVAPDSLSESKTSVTPSTDKVVLPLTKKDAVPVDTVTITSINVDEMRQKLTTARNELEATLRVQYGTFYQSIFFDSDKSRGRSLFTSGDASSQTSWLRFRRKLMIKLLLTATSSTTSKKDIPFVWATGGHSSTAGHGNFFHESYTAYLERAAQPVLAAVGLHFTARNHAMGGTAAGPEIALCVKEIFGTDVDVLVWDYGMTDGKDVWKQSLYQWRAGLLPSRPVNLVFHAGGRSYSRRIDAAQEMERNGLAALISSESVLDAAMAAVPDSFGRTKEDIDTMPQFVRNFRCGQQLELGDPYCGAEKYNLTQCERRKFRANWHPGWKWHAVTGYLAAHFLIEVLDDAVQELAKRSIVSPIDLFNKLQREEDADYLHFTQTPVPDYFQEILPPTNMDGFDVDRFIKGNNICHTAKLPAVIRHLGILTESTQIGFYSYDVGLGLNQAKAGPLPGDSMPLVYTEGDRQDCPIPLNMDYKDYFFVNSVDSWKKLIVPNDAELKHYSDGQSLYGLVLVCFTLCSWGKCPAGVLHPKTFPDKFAMQVNGVDVTILREFQECALLQHDNGFRWPPNKQGQLELRVRVNEGAAPGSYVRVSSVIVW
jgi:hypothetical protein